ncbi:MAG: hypothetical protein R3B84_21400 [Zavarzinella sp.]
MWQKLSLFAVLCSTILVVGATREEDAKKFAGQLKHKDAKMRLGALDELKKLGAAQRRLTEPYTSDIANCLKDSDARVRGAAAETLSHIDPKDQKEAMTQLVTALKAEKEEAARIGMVNAIGELGALTSDADLKKTARTTLMELRQKSESKREQRAIQTAMQMIMPKKKKN